MLLSPLRRAHVQQREKKRRLAKAEVRGEREEHGDEEEEEEVWREGDIPDDEPKGNAGEGEGAEKS